MSKPKRQRVQKDMLKNADLGTEAFAKKILHWHREVAKDFEREFGSQVYMFVANAIYVRQGEGNDSGTLSWIGSPANTVNLIGHLIRQLAKDGVEKYGMTPEQSAASLMAAITETASLNMLETFVGEAPIDGVEKVQPQTGIFLPGQG